MKVVLCEGARIVISPPGREAVLHELHEGHPGITRMKFLARMCLVACDQC